jgi:hypothetical protein
MLHTASDLVIFFGSGYGSVADSCEYDTGTSGTIKHGKYLYQLNNYNFIASQPVSARITNGISF